jgi:Phage tail tube protein
MGIPSGLGAQLGAKRESVFGTYVAPDAFYEFDAETLSRQPNYLTSTGLRANRMAPPVARHKPTTRSASGEVTMKVPTKGFGRWLDLLHGNVVTPEKIGASTAYKQVHNIGTSAPIGKSLTVQVGKPDVAGVVQPFSYPGTKVTQLALTCETGAELMAALSLNARDEVTGEPLATASYPTGIASLDFVGGEVKVGADSLGIVGSAGLTVPLPMKTDRFGLNKSALAAEPLPNDYIKPTGQMAMEFFGLTQLNHFYNCDSVKVTLLFEGATISEANKEKLELVVPAAHFVGASPQVGGPDVLSVQYPFEAYDNGTEAPVIATYVSADTTL